MHWRYSYPCTSGTKWFCVACLYKCEQASVCTMVSLPMFIAANDIIFYHNSIYCISETGRVSILACKVPVKSGLDAFIGFDN